MEEAKTVTATFTALPADRCATATAADCIRAVYRGAPSDYAQVSDIPADVLVMPATDGRYYVARGQQITVVTAAPLPAGWTRFYLQQTPWGRLRRCRMGSSSSHSGPPTRSRSRPTRLPQR